MKRQQHNTSSLRGGTQPDAAIYSEHTRLLRFLLRPSGFAGQDARNDRERDNALWFILIAIALLGLLTVMLSHSGSSTNETGGYEQNVIAANEILSYAKNMENAVQGLLARGCSENELSFWHDSDGNGVEDASDDYFNTVSTRTDRSCHIFDVAGAGLSWNTPNERWLDGGDDTRFNYEDFSISGNNVIANIETSGDDLAIILNWLNQDICTSINNVIFSDATITEDGDDFSHSNRFDGTFGNASATLDLSSYAPHDGQPTACFTSENNGDNHFCLLYTSPSPRDRG